MLDCYTYITIYNVYGQYLQKGCDLFFAIFLYIKIQVLILFNQVKTNI